MDNFSLKSWLFGVQLYAKNTNRKRNHQINWMMKRNPSNNKTKSFEWTKKNAEINSISPKKNYSREIFIASFHIFFFSLEKKISFLFAFLYTPAQYFSVWNLLFLWIHFGAKKKWKIISFTFLFIRIEERRRIINILKYITLSFWKKCFFLLFLFTFKNFFIINIMQLKCSFYTFFCRWIPSAKNNRKHGRKNKLVREKKTSMKSSNANMRFNGSTTRKRKKKRKKEILNYKSRRNVICCYYNIIHFVNENSGNIWRMIVLTLVFSFI